MAITTLTLNGVQIETTASLAEIVSALPTNTPAQQPKAADEPTPEPKARQARPKATKRTTEPKARQARQPKAGKVNGKALWADITKAVQNGDYVTARRLAEPKPDTFGVQTEAAIARHMAKQAKQPKAGNQPPQPKAEAEAAKPADQPKAGKPSSLPRKGEEVEVKRVTPKAVAEQIDAKARAAAKAADEAHDNERPTEAPKVTRKRNHKADCGCPTCPKGIAARKAKVADVVGKAPTKAQAKAAVAKAVADAPKGRNVEPKAPKQPKAEALAEQEAAALQREADRILAKSLEQAEGLAKTLDITGLHEATRKCLVLANRNQRLGNVSLYEAYKDSADLFQDALAEAKAGTLA